MKVYLAFYGKMNGDHIDGYPLEIITEERYMQIRNQYENDSPPINVMQFELQEKK